MSELKIGDLIRHKDNSYFMRNNNRYADGILINIDPIIIISSDFEVNFDYYTDITIFKRIGIITDEEVIKICFNVANMSYKKYKREVLLNEILEDK